MAYSNGVFYIDLVNGNDAARTALTSCTASNPAGSVTRINKTGHGLVTGAVVDLTLFSTWLNDAWKITVVDADNFDLDGAVWQATADASGTVTPRGGSSKTDAWLTLHNGATNTRVAGGDVCRVMESPAPTSLGQNATWTYDSSTVTLTSSVTQTIANCETAWTASANVTATTTTTCKQGSNAANIAIAAGFTTGKIAYFATGALDLSAYQQVSLWLRVTSGTLANLANVSINLCSDTTGDVPVNTFALGAQAATGRFIALRFDNGAALGNNINSISLSASVDPATMTIILDNIIACKPSSSADALTLQSLIGKVNNMPWSANTTYATGAIRRPSAVKRNGFVYEVTAGGGGNSGVTEPVWPAYWGGTVSDGALTWTCKDQWLEDTWYTIQSIDGTTVKLDGPSNSSPTVETRYQYATESVLTYKREPITYTGMTSASTGMLVGSTAGVDYIGGYAASDMQTLTGETWIASRNGIGVGATCGGSVGFVGGGFRNFGFARMSQAISTGAITGAYFSNIHAVSLGLDNYVMTHGAIDNLVYAMTVGIASNVTFGGGERGGRYRISKLSVLGCVPASAYPVVTLDSEGDVNWLVIRSDLVGDGQLNIEGAGVTLINVACKGVADLFYKNSAVSTPSSVRVKNLYLNDMDLHDSGTNLSYLYIDNLDSDGKSYVLPLEQNVNNFIETVTDQRHTASGYSRKFRTDVQYNPSDKVPIQACISRRLVNSGSLVTFSVWVRRDNSAIIGKIRVVGGYIAGVMEDVVQLCEPSINTWTQYSVSFTPAVKGVVEVNFEVWGGDNHSLWIDDISWSQA